MRRKSIGTLVAIAVFLVPALLLAEGTKVRYYTYRSQTRAVKPAPVSTQSSVTVTVSKTSNHSVHYAYSNIQWGKPRRVPVEYSYSRFSYHYRPRYRWYAGRLGYGCYLPVPYYGYPYYPIFGYRRIRPGVWVPIGYGGYGYGRRARWGVSIAWFR